MAAEKDLLELGLHLELVLQELGYQLEASPDQQVAYSALLVELAVHLDLLELVHFDLQLGPSFSLLYFSIGNPSLPLLLCLFKLPFSSFYAITDRPQQSCYHIHKPNIKPKFSV